MAAIKTAVCLDEDLLERIDQAARALRLDRSRLIARAADEFLTEHENRKLLERLDRAYTHPPTADEAELRRGRRRRRRAVEGSW